MSTESSLPLPTMPGSFIRVDGELKPNPPQIEPEMREWLTENGYFDPQPATSQPPARIPQPKPETKPVTTLDDVVNFLVEYFDFQDHLERHGETREDVVDFDGHQTWNEYAENFCFAYESIFVWTKKRVYFLSFFDDDCAYRLVSGPRNPDRSDTPSG